MSSPRYEVVRWDGLTMHAVGEADTFTTARRLAESAHMQARASTVLVFDAANEDAEVWRISPAPRGDIPCHSPTFVGKH